MPTRPFFFDPYGLYSGSYPGPATFSGAGDQGAFTGGQSLQAQGTTGGATSVAPAAQAQAGAPQSLRAPTNFQPPLGATQPANNFNDPRPPPFVPLPISQQYHGPIFGAGSGAYGWNPLFPQHGVGGVYGPYGDWRGSGF